MPRGDFLVLQNVIKCQYMAVEQVQSIDLSGILNSSHENKWVAIAPDYSRVLAASNELKDLMHTIKDGNAIFHRVLPHEVSFAPFAKK